MLDDLAKKYFWLYMGWLGIVVLIVAFVEGN